MWLFRITLPSAIYGDDGDLWVATDGETMRTERHPDPAAGLAALIDGEPDAPYCVADPAWAELVEGRALDHREPSAEARRFVTLLLFGLGWGQEAADADNALLLALADAARDLLALDAEAIATHVPVSVRFRRAFPVRGVSLAWCRLRDGASHVIVLAPTVADACTAARHHFDGEGDAAADIDHLVLRLAGGDAPLRDDWARWAELACVPTLECFEDGEVVAIDDADVLQTLLSVMALARRVRGEEGRDAARLEIGTAEAVASIVEPRERASAPDAEDELARGAMLLLALADAADEDEAALYHYDEALELAHLLPLEHAVGAHLRRGTVLEALDEPDRALEDYAAALALDPDSADATFRRANCRAIHGDLRGALEDFDRLAVLRPDAEAFRLRALVHTHLGNTAAARADERRSQALGDV